MFATRATTRWLVAMFVLTSVLGVQVTAASAARRHRHRRHHHVSPPVVDPGVPGPLTVSPSPVVMTLGGAWTASMTGAGLPPGMPLTIDDHAVANACPGTTPPPPPPPPGDGRLLAPIEFVPTVDTPHLVTDRDPISDDGGLFSVGLTCPGPSVPGTYPIFVTEDQSPFQTFTVLITLTFA